MYSLISQKIFHPLRVTARPCLGIKATHTGTVSVTQRTVMTQTPTPKRDDTYPDYRHRPIKEVRHKQRKGVTTSPLLYTPITK